MKKLVFSFALFCALCMASCGNGAKTNSTETVTDTTVVEEVVSTEVTTDTVAVEEVATEAEKVEEKSI